MNKNIYINLLMNKSFMSFWSSTTLLHLASNIIQFSLAIYVLDITGSAFIYSTVLSIIILPRILCSSFAGYLADYKNSIQILRWCALILTGIMACFFIIHIFIIPLNIVLIYAFVILLELCETFLGPTETKILTCIITTDEIAPASKLSSLDDGIVEIISPIIAALFYSYFNLIGILIIIIFLEGIAFLLTFFITRRFTNSVNSVKTNIYSIFSFKNVYNSYRDAILCLKNHTYIIGIILFAPLFNFFISPLFSVIAPHYFRITMQTDIDIYAIFNTVLGISGLIAPFFAMIFINDKYEYRANKIGTVVSTFILICLSYILYFYNDIITENISLFTVIIAMVLLMVIITIMNIATSITVKKRIPAEIIGRVISIIQLCATISVPLGQIFFGFCADKFPLYLSYLISAGGLILTFIIMIITYKTIKIHKELY